MKRNVLPGLRFVLSSSTSGRKNPLHYFLLDKSQKRPFHHQGFSLLTPKTLTEVVKLDVLMQESTDRIKEIWAEYQKAKSGMVCGDIESDIDELIRKRAKESPMFIFPVFKDEDKFMIMLSQFQENMFVLTYLDEYKRDPTTARPWLQFTIYDELIDKKSISLYRADFTPDLSSVESHSLVNMILQAYKNDDIYGTHVVNFNKNHDAFDFQGYCDSMKLLRGFDHRDPSES
jgi:ATP synthase mitochondrial F1 complex assembly factor 1